MKKILTTLLLVISFNQSLLWSNTLENQQEELKKILSLRFKYDNLKNIRDNYEKELHVLEIQYERNKQIEDFQKRQKEEEIKTAVYTSPFNFITSQEWEQGFIKYVNAISLTKVARRNSTELIFHFPPISSKIKNQLNNYRTEMPIVKVTSVLLSSGKLITVDKKISAKIDEQSLSIETEDATVLKVNLSMTYLLPIEKNAKVILSKQSPNNHDMQLLPAFNNVALIELDAKKATSIIQIDAIDVKGNTLATRTPEKLNNINELSIQATRIDLLANFIQAIDDRTIKNTQEAIDFFVENSASYLVSVNKQTRHLSKSFAGKIEQVVIYTIDNPIEKQYDFSIY